MKIHYGFSQERAELQPLHFTMFFTEKTTTPPQNLVNKILSKSVDNDCSNIPALKWK